MTKALLVLAALLASFGAAAQDTVAAVATTPELGSLVKIVGGDLVAVRVAETQAKPAERRAALRGAALLVRRGLGLDPWLDTAKLPRRLLLVDASEGVRIVHGNRYYWLDPHNAQPITASILAALVKLRPAEEARFQANRDAFLSLLNEKLFQWERKLA